MNYVLKIVTAEGSSGSNGWARAKRERSRENTYYERYCFIQVTCNQACNQLGTPGGEGFSVGGPNFLNYVQHIFQGFSPLVTDLPTTWMRKARHATKIYEQWQGPKKRARVNNLVIWDREWWHKDTKQPSSRSPI